MTLRLARSLSRAALNVVLWLTTQSVLATELRPRDEGVKDRSFGQFRTGLLDVVQRKDKGALVAALSPNIKNSFGGDGGVKEFQEAWKGRDQELWQELSFILRNGGKFGVGGEFCGPYIFSHWPDRYDPFENYAALSAPNVALKGRRTSESEILASLSYAVVKVLDDRWWERKGGLVRVSAGGKVGFVPRANVRSPIEYRACFGSIDGKWTITSFVSGD